MDIKEKANIRRYWEHNPHQKAILKVLDTVENVKYKFDIGHRGYNRFYKSLKALYWLMELDKDEIISVYKKDEIIEMSRDELADKIFNDLKLYK